MHTEDDTNSDKITPEAVYLNRRGFMRLGLLGGSAFLTAMAYRWFSPEALVDLPARLENGGDLIDSQNTFEEITNYNNFYEFSTAKTDVASKASVLVTRPWSIEVYGLVRNVRTFAIEELLQFPQDERVYRFRCVEGWSMVIPWVGFPLSRLLELVEPLETARYVAFESFYDPSVMQSPFSAGIEFPYVEGLRLDEAMHPLTILATGLYRKPMPNQNGAPLRLVVPWKYGFKSIKSIAKITLTEEEPTTTWSNASPREYGFYSNVNPDVDHPRWSQKTERRIGEFSRRKTLLFNGYADDVSHLYEGMDLRQNY